MDVVYAALIEDLPPEVRAQVDEELALPLGVTGKAIEDAHKEWKAAQGW